MVQVGDMIYIKDYGYPDDNDLIDWAYEQDEDYFKVREVDIKNKIFYIEGCDYAIAFDSVDYVIKRG